MSDLFAYWEIGLAFVALLGALGFIYWCDWDARRRLKAYTNLQEKDKAELEDTFRKTAQVIGGAAVVLVFAYTLTKDSGTFRQARAQMAATTYSEAIKLLDQSIPSALIPSALIPSAALIPALILCRLSFTATVGIGDCCFNYPDDYKRDDIRYSDTRSRISIFAP